jgi:phage tail sheath protein FI
MSAFLHGVQIKEATSGTRPVQTVSSSVIGLIGTAPDATDAFPLNTPVVIAGRRSEATGLGKTGTLPDAVDGILDQIGATIVVVRVKEEAEVDGGESATMNNIVGGVNATTGDYEGAQIFLGAESAVGHAPRILCAPGYTHQRLNNAPNTVVQELASIANRIRAVVIADGPSTTDADALTYRDDFGTVDNGEHRIYIVDPAVKVATDTVPKVEPASARVAGMIARSDSQRGFWWSPSNQGVSGIIGTERAVDFQLGDVNARANKLNEKDVATIIRQNGFRLWGNRTASKDSKWAFLSVVRTADMINDSLLRAHLWAVDKNITKTYIEDVTNSVQGYLDGLKAQGAILGGSIWADEESNTPESIAAGKIYFNFDFTPPMPAEQIVFTSILTNDYIEEIL